MTIICDLDDTLIYTTQLNNDAYNYALEHFGYKRIDDTDRIIRQCLNFINKTALDKIIALKQIYFNQNWLKYRTIINEILLNKLKTYGKQNCYLWTTADKTRVSSITWHYQLDRYFSDIIFDPKTNFVNSLDLIKTKCCFKNCIIYENNPNNFNPLFHQIKMVDHISTNSFDVKGYMINL